MTRSTQPPREIRDNFPDGATLTHDRTDVRLFAWMLRRHMDRRGMLNHASKEPEGPGAAATAAAGPGD